MSQRLYPFSERENKDREIENKRSLNIRPVNDSNWKIP